MFDDSFSAEDFVAANPALTSRHEIESIWSQLGVDLRLDDDDDGVVHPDLEEPWLDDAIGEATDIVNGYLANVYDPTLLIHVRRVRRFASYIAAHAIARRRGNPGAFCEEVEQIVKDMEDIIDGKQILPSVPRRGEFLPMAINFTIDRRYAREKMRVDRFEGVDGDVKGSKPDFYNGWFYF